MSSWTHHNRLNEEKGGNNIENLKESLVEMMESVVTPEELAM